MSDPVDSLLRTSAGRHPARAALVHAGRRTTYAELDAAAERLAGSLRESAGPGDRVAVVAPNVPALVVALFACWRAGAVAVPLGARAREYELGQVLADARPAAVVSVAAHQRFSFREVLPGIAERLPGLRELVFVDARGEPLERVGASAQDGEPLAMAPQTQAILYTSGTTGEPKGALVTGGCAEAGGIALAERLALTPEDVAALIIPAAHAFGLGALLATIASGGAAVLVEQSFSFEPLLQAMDEQGVTVLHGSPALFGRMLLSAPEALGGIRAGGPLRRAGRTTLPRRATAASGARCRATSSARSATSRARSRSAGRT
jgi:acyl-CoA synthetase (AMP-forming)/AMP-acid ligase II